MKAAGNGKGYRGPRNSEGPKWDPKISSAFTTRAMVLAQAQALLRDFEDTRGSFEP